MNTAWTAAYRVVDGVPLSSRDTDSEESIASAGERETLDRSAAACATAKASKDSDAPAHAVERRRSLSELLCFCGWPRMDISRSLARKTQFSYIHVIHAEYRRATQGEKEAAAHHLWVFL